MEDQTIILAFGIALKKFRLEANLTQEKLAFMAGLHPTYISHLETGKKQPTITTIFKIAEQLKISPIDFIGGVVKILK